MCNQTFCTFAAPNCGILFDYYLVYFSITIYRVYANASIPGTGIYKRQKISGGKTSSKDDSDYLLNTNLCTEYNHISTYPLISGDSVRMRLIKSKYYVPYVLSLLLPLVCIVVSFFVEMNWGRVFPIILFQFICYFYCAANKYFFEYEWYSGYLELEYYANPVIRSHWIRCGLAVSIMLVNFILFCIAFKYSVELYSSSVCFVLVIVCIFMFFAWMTLALYDKDFAKEWDEIVIPSNEKADNERKFDNNLKFNNIIIGDYAKNYLSGGWVKVDEFDDYQVYFVQKNIILHEVNLKCDCFIHCIGEKIGFIEVIHCLEKNDDALTQNKRYKDIVESLYILYVKKYGLHKENIVKDFDFRFTRTWNYLNQRIVFQHRIFEERTEESYFEEIHQVKINYVDNELYKHIRDIWMNEYRKRRNEQLEKVEQENEEQRRKIEEEEQKKNEQFLKESELI